MTRFCRRLATLLRAIKGKGYGQAEEKETEDLTATKPYALRTKKRAYLKIAAGLPFDHGSIVLEPGLTVGRAAHCRLRLADQEVSRVHAQFIKDGPAWKIVDRGSTNGILVNGDRVASAPLMAGDRIEIGQVVLIYEER